MSAAPSRARCSRPAAGRAIRRGRPTDAGSRPAACSSRSRSTTSSRASSSDRRTAPESRGCSRPTSIGRSATGSTRISTAGSSTGDTGRSGSMTSGSWRRSPTADGRIRTSSGSTRRPVQRRSHRRRASGDIDDPHDRRRADGGRIATLGTRRHARDGAADARRRRRRDAGDAPRRPDRAFGSRWQDAFDDAGDAPRPGARALAARSMSGSRRRRAPAMPPSPRSSTSTAARWVPGRRRRTSRSSFSSPHGYRVILPNIRGSATYGRDWIRPQLGDWGGVDAADVHAAVDHVVALGLADPDRLGVMGLSYGGFMTNWLVGTTDRFKAAVSENGVTNQVADWANSDSGPEFNRAALLGDPLSPEGHRQALAAVTAAQRRERPDAAPDAPRRRPITAAPPRTTSSSSSRCVISAGRSSTCSTRTSTTSTQTQAGPTAASTATSGCSTGSTGTSADRRDVSATVDWPHPGIAPAGHGGHHRPMTLPDRRFRRSVPAAIAATLVVLLVASTTAVAAADFPRGYTGYHTYAEVGAAAKAVADAHPAIASRFSIGKSYQGRELWAMKISDNVGTDENEPEVLYDGGHHADEHMGVEMALRIMRWLVDGYGTRHAHHQHRQRPRDLDHLPRQSRWRRVRHRERSIPLLAQEPPADARDGLHRHRSEPELRISLGRWRTHELEPGGHHVPRPEGMVGARDARCARLPGEPRRRRQAADPDAHHVPRGRPPRDVAVRLHLRRPCRPT